MAYDSATVQQVRVSPTHIASSYLQTFLQADTEQPQGTHTSVTPDPQDPVQERGVAWSGRGGAYKRLCVLVVGVVLCVLLVVALVVGILSLVILFTGVVDTAVCNCASGESAQ